MISVGNGYAIQPTNSEYGGINQRWLIVHSEQFEQRENKQLDKQVAQATMQLKKSTEKLNRQEFACEKDARKAIVKFEKKLKWHSITATYHPMARSFFIGNEWVGYRKNARWKNSCYI